MRANGVLDAGHPFLTRTIRAPMSWTGILYRLRATFLYSNLGVHTCGRITDDPRVNTWCGWRGGNGSGLRGLATRAVDCCQPCDESTHQEM